MTRKGAVLALLGVGVWFFVTSITNNVNSLFVTELSCTAHALKYVIIFIVCHYMELVSSSREFQEDCFGLIVTHTGLHIRNESKYCA